MLVATPSAGARYASGCALVLTWLGFAILVALAFVSVAWTALLVGLVVLTVRRRRAMRTARWELDHPGPEARLRFGPNASRSVLLAEVDAVLRLRVPGATSKGIPVTRDHERWWFVDAAGRAIDEASTEGLDTATVERFRSALERPFVPFAVARRLGELPSGIPWSVRHQGATLTIAIVASFAAVVVLFAVPTYWG